MRLALQDTVVLGVTTNIPYLLDILDHPAFVAGEITTNFLDEHMMPWEPDADVSNSTWLAIAALEALSGKGAGDESPGRRWSAARDRPLGGSERWRNVP
jgi:acetyl/propionyl-CoA carboxylase alpha subunit